MQCRNEQASIQNLQFISLIFPGSSRMHDFSRPKHHLNVHANVTTHFHIYLLLP